MTNTYYPSGEDTPPPVPNYVPALVQLHDAIPQPDAQAAIGEAGAYINDHFQQRRIADQSQQAQNQFIQNMGTFRSGLMQMVQSDPTSVHAAMKAAVPVISAVAHSTTDDPDPHIATLTSEMHRDLATTAVTSAANQNADVARGMLNDPRLASVLPEDHTAQLNRYIDLQDRARQVDNASQQIQAQKLADTQSNQVMFKYAADLFNPATGNSVLPARWNQAVLADNSVTPQDTATLRQLYARVASGNAPKASDPFLISNMVQAMARGSGPPVRDILSHTATGKLAFDHGLYLASLSADKTRTGQAHASGLAALLTQGRNAITSANPIAAGPAYARYVNWLVPRYAGTGPAGANPDDEAYLLNGGVGAFMPRAEDMAPPPPGGPRKPLKDIFGVR